MVTPDDDPSVEPRDDLILGKALTVHPVAALFPDMSPGDFAALIEDIRQNGVRTPILVHDGQILDGRHRYRACQQLGIACPTVNWNGRALWLEVQSRNLIRRHLSKEQVYAIRKLAIERFPDLAAPIEAAKTRAKQRKAQAKGGRRGQKALSRSHDRRRESADEVGALLGVSGTTVKRVDRLARTAPELLPRVAAGEMSVKRALREAAIKRHGQVDRQKELARGFLVDLGLDRLQRAIKGEWARWPQKHRPVFLRGLQQLLRELVYDYKSVTDAAGAGTNAGATRS
jgi:ParB-like chromosome segregation protein Spo0J